MRIVNRGAAPAAGRWCAGGLVPRRRTGGEGHGGSAPTKDLTVHEWGTFSTFSGSDGINLTFQPYDNDLPQFVHGYLQQETPRQGHEDEYSSLETPVLYFYSGESLTASVPSGLPQGHHSPSGFPRPLGRTTG